MTWRARAMQSPVVPDSGSIQTQVQIDDGAGHTYTPMVANDGTLAGLTAAVKAVIAQHDPTTGVRPVVAPGTVLDLSDPPPPAPPSAADVARSTWFTNYHAYLRYSEGLRLGLSGYDSGTQATMLGTLQSNWIANDPTYDAMLQG